MLECDKLCQDGWCYNHRW